MNDPHVEALYYSVKHSQHVDFSKAAPFEHEEQDFSIQIAGKRAQIRMKDHFPSLAEARTVVEPFLRAWELGMGLRQGPRTLEFVYESGQVIDRNPTAGVLVLVPESMNLKITLNAPSVTVLFTTFPGPPTGMACTPLWIGCSISTSFIGTVELLSPLLPTFV